MNEWIDKDGYSTCRLADAAHLRCPGTEIQLVRFHQGKTEHYHKTKTEFFYFTSGCGSIVIDGVTSTLRADISVVVHPKQRHTFINDSNEPLEAIQIKMNSTSDDTFQT